MISDDQRIVFLTLPESFNNEFHIDGVKNQFKFEQSIPLPVELPDGKKKFNLNELTIEMLVSGMLCVIARGEPAEHIFYYRNFVIAVRPDIMQELGGTAIIKAKNGDYACARNIIVILKALFPDSAHVLLLNAVILEEEAARLKHTRAEQDFAHAEKHVEIAYKAALSAETLLPDTLFNAAFFYMKRQNFGKARDYFKEYIHCADDDSKKKTAVKQLRIIEKNNLDDEHFLLAYDLISTGMEERGMEELRAFLEKYPNVWKGWFMLGWALRRLGRWQDGAAALRKALDLGGGNHENHNELAICLMEMGKLQEAKQELEAALACEPENTKIISNLGVVYLKMGDKKTAEGFFRTVLEFAPDDPLAGKFLSG
jgi:tetratricopeptide (TPR) repeat protein